MIGKEKFFNLHTHIVILITAVAILQMNLLGTVGLVIYGLLIAYSFLTLLYNRKSIVFCKPRILYVMVAYFLYYMLCTTINGAFVDCFTTLLQFLLLSLVCFYLRDPKDIDYDYITISKGLSIMGIVMGLGSLAIPFAAVHFPDFVASLPITIQEYISQTTFLRGTDRIIGFAGHPNYTASYCAICSMFSVYMLFRTETKTSWRIVSVFNVFLSLYIIFISTASRTSMLALASFLGTYFLTLCIKLGKDNKTLLRILTILLITAVAIIGLAALTIALDTNIGNYLLHDVIRINSLATGSGRLQLYSDLWEAGKGHRIFGISRYAIADAIGMPKVYQAHNLLLHILTVAGIPGLVLLVVYFGYSALVATRNVINAKDKTTTFVCCFNLAFIVAYLVHGLFEFGSIDRIRLISVCINFFFVYSHVIAWQLDKLNEKKLD